MGMIYLLEICLSDKYQACQKVQSDISPKQKHILFILDMNPLFLNCHFGSGSNLLEDPTWIISISGNTTFMVSYKNYIQACVCNSIDSHSLYRWSGKLVVVAVKRFFFCQPCYRSHVFYCFYGNLQNNNKIFFLGNLSDSFSYYQHYDKNAFIYVDLLTIILSWFMKIFVE